MHQHTAQILTCAHDYIDTNDPFSTLQSNANHAFDISSDSE